MLDEAKYFIRKPKAIEDLVNHVATILGREKMRSAGNLRRLCK
jgi:hypothetical protein